MVGQRLGWNGDFMLSWDYIVAPTMPLYRIHVLWAKEKYWPKLI